MAPQQSAAAGNTSQARRSREYYIAEGDVTFKVENTIFRVHKFFFYRESAYFQHLFRSPSIPCNDPPGSSETNPVVLKDTTSEAFSGLCWVFYNQNYSVYTTTVEKWVEILALAQKWAFKEVEQLCVREMQKLPIEPEDKIYIYQVFHLERALLAESFAKLTVRPRPLNLEEGNKLGIETTLQIAQARELSRGSHSGTRTSTIQLNDSELRSVIRDVFALGEEALDFLVDPLQPSPPPSTSENINTTRKPKK